jgi:hypothetical protein
MNVSQLKASPHPQDPRNKSFLIAGVVRNGEKTIVNEIFHLAKVFKNFSNLQWFVVESDSSDQTIEKLEELTKTIPSFRYRSAGALADQMPSRLVRLAHCRNLYLEEFHQNPIYQNIDYLVVADLDNMNPLLTEKALLSCWDREGWGACCANQRGPYYDLGALRHPDWMPIDCWRHYQFLLKQTKSVDKAMEAAIYANMITIDEDNDWIEVDSAFGGLAIYPAKALGGARYKGYDAHGQESVDHIGLHEDIRKNGYSIYINPKLINTSFNGHNQQLLESRRLKKKLKEYFKFCNPIKLLPFLWSKAHLIRTQKTFLE